MTEKGFESGKMEKKKGFFSRLAAIFTGHGSIDEEFYEDLEETMITGDVGIKTTEEILDELREKVRNEKISDPSECRSILTESIRNKMDLGENAYEFENRKSVVLLVGVNGVGKTTTAGKLAFLLKAQGKRVLLAAADTFRAAAIEQLAVWSERAGVELISSVSGSDPASVLFDACAAAKARNTDVLIVDTAGRLHNKKNLMEELKKINRIIEKQFPEAFRETLIVLDAATGQNALEQVREFKEAANPDGIVLTKLDGSSKGGIVIAIQAEMKIPVKYIGVGEKISDLKKFDSGEFVHSLLLQNGNGKEETNEKSKS